MNIKFILKFVLGLLSIPVFFFVVVSIISGISCLLFGSSFTEVSSNTVTLFIGTGATLLYSVSLMVSAD